MTAAAGDQSPDSHSGESAAAAAAPAGPSGPSGSHPRILAASVAPGCVVLSTSGSHALQMLQLSSSAGEQQLVAGNRKRGRQVRVTTAVPCSLLTLTIA